MILRATLAVLALCLSPAIAQDLIVFGGAELEYSVEPDGQGSDDTAELSAYLEAEKNGFYGGIWAMVANESASDEIDLYVGYRGATEGGLDYDFAYTRYIYPNDGGDCCGELSLGLGYALGESLYPSFDVYIDPENSVGSAYVGLEYYVDDKWTLSANYGVYETEGAPSEQEWDFGVGYALGEETAVDVRYYDGSDYDGYLGLSLTWDTTILGG
jgi:hypothetical protein